MSINNDWDVEKHKMEHECDEHWELRRKFLLAHKTKFPEDELVCLAQVFSNVELLGCRYPQETMDLVAELSEEIAAEYREKQKTKLQRTFVKASEAASSKVKGCIAQISTIAEQPISDKSNKKLKSEIEETKTVNNNKSPSANIIESSSKKKGNLPFGDIILVERPGDVPQNTLAHSVGISRNNLKWVYANQSTKFQHSYDCTIYIDSKKVAFASGYNRKIARKAASAIALDRLRKYYHTIKIKQNSDAQTNVNLMTIEKTKSQDDIPDDNIGKKLMKLMGWSGGGLGKSQQGIMEPVTLKQQLSREGLGLKSSSSNMHELKAKCRIAFKEFLMGDMQNDIVFSTDFTNDERAMIHQVARSMGLKSRSHGPSDQRKLVISRKVNIRSLVEELKSLGGTTEKYELIEPTYLDDDELDSIDGTTEKDELIESTNLDEEMKDFEETTERYESIKPTSSVEELDKRCIDIKSSITEELISNKSNIKSEVEETKIVNNHKPSTSVMESLSKEKKDLPYGDIILVEKPGDEKPATILKHSVGICGRNIKWEYTKLDNSCNCTIYINSEQVACAINCKKEFAKEAASALALDRLRKYYHTVKIKQSPNATLTTKEKTKSQNNNLCTDNSRKLMKLLGWTHESLRSSQQGNMEPVILKQQLNREDLGLKSSSPNMCELKAKCKIIFKKLFMGDMQNDIVFSTDFTNKEKETLLHIARLMGLKSYIDDSSDPTKLVIFHKVNVQSLLEKLKSLAGTTETYELIQPTDLDNELNIVDRTIEKYKLIESANLDEKAKDLEDSIEKYESIETTGLVEETRCITQTSIITKKAISNKTNKKLKSEIEDTTETLNNYKRPSTNVMESSCKKEKNPYGDIILVEKPGDVPETILMNSVGISRKNCKYKRTKFCNAIDYTICINSKQVACASDCSRKYGKKAIFALALDELRKYYHTIKMKQNSDAVMNVTLTMIEKMKSEDTISDDNIGKKLLKLMGWSGGGLGKSQQGIMEPVTYAQHLGRQGLGLKSCSSNMEVNQELKAKCKIIFEKLLRGDIQNNVVFSTDFTNDEKAMIHEVARSMGLKSCSRGPSDKAKLVISHKIDIRSLFEELKSGRTNEKYELIKPTHLDDKLDSVDGTTEKYDLTESTSLVGEMKDFEWTTEKYESIEPTNLVEELDQKCIAKKSTIIKEHISDQSNKIFKSEVEETKTENNPSTSIMGSPSKKNKDLPYGDIILVEEPGDVPETILNASIGISSKNIQYTCIKFHHSCYCTICINSIQVASVSDCTKKDGKAAAFALALDELRKYYPTVKIKQNPGAQTNANLTTIQKTIFQKKILDDNIEKLMKLLGWTHDILGNCQQDIMKSVIVTHSKRLRSFAYGPLNQKKLVSKIDIPSLIKKLKKLAGTTEKYELIEPINLDYKLDNVDETTEKYEIESTSLDEEVKDLEGITEKYESSLVEELNTRCIIQTSTIIEKPILDETNKKLKSEIEDTETVSDHKSSGTSIMESLSKDKKDLLYGNIILVEKPGDVPETILKHSFGISSKNLNWRFTKFYNACATRQCTIYINSNQVACASECSRKCAKETAFALALNELRKYYYTIKIKQNTDSQTNVTLTTVEETMSQDNIREDKIEKKLMKLIGQSGDIIIDSLQNMKEPVTLNKELGREDLDLTSNSSSMCELKAKCKIAFEKFLLEDIQYNIIFSTDFTNDERLIIHQVACSMGLESRNRSSRQKLIISRGFNILSLVEELKSLGGTTEKYELIEPTNLHDKVENVDESTEKYEIGSTSLDEEVKDLDGTTKKYESIEPINEFWWNYEEIQIDKTK